MSSTIELKPMEMPFSNDPIQSYTMAHDTTLTH